MTDTATAGPAQPAGLVRHAGPAEPDIAPVPDALGHFVVGAVGVTEVGGACEAPGVAYGGRFAPEALMAALDELAAAYEQARKDQAFRAELDGLLRGYAARPTLLYRAERFGQQAGGCTVLLKREDLAHARAVHPDQRAGGACKAWPAMPLVKARSHLPAAPQPVP